MSWLKRKMLDFIKSDLRIQIRPCENKYKTEYVLQIYSKGWKDCPVTVVTHLDETLYSYE